MNKRKKISILSIILVLILAGIAVYFSDAKKSSIMPAQTASNKQTAESDLNRIFDIAEKEPGTKLYYSEKLGVGFTYLPYSWNSPVEISESDNKINVASQTIEIFAKNPNISLEGAIKEKFLQGYDPKECFVKIYNGNEQKLSNYISAGISFPPSDIPGSPWWQNADKCPQGYSETNGVQYFLMNEDSPDRFIFVKLGQAPAASDGTPQTENSNFNWSHSIRIVK